MAITIISQPQIYTPVYNGLKFEVSSDNTGEPNFQYVFDIIYDGAFQTRHRVQANPATGNGKFNAMRIIESVITHDDFADLDSSFINALNGYKKLSVEFKEEYDIAGVLTLSATLETSDDIYAYNGSYPYLDFTTFDYTDCDLTDVTSQFLTGATHAQKIKLDERAWLYSRCSVPARYARKQVKTYSVAGVLLNTYNLSNSFNNNALEADQFIRASVGPAQLDAEGVSFTNVSYYTVQAQNGGGTVYSKLMTYTIDSNCSKYASIRLHFLNTCGGFDSFTFTGQNERKLEIKKVDYKTGEPFTTSASDRLISTSNTSLKQKITLNSDWLSEEEMIWLEQLVTSPIIFQELNDNLIPVNCTDLKVDQKQKVNDKLFNLKLNLSYTYTSYRQRY